jgi:hypothetical protein
VRDGFVPATLAVDVLVLSRVVVLVCSGRAHLRVLSCPGGCLRFE